MLNKLIDYGKQADAFLEPGFAKKSIRWAIHCNEQGNFQGVVPLGTDKKGKPFLVPHLSQGELIKGGVTRSQFLVEALQTVIEWGAEEKDKEKFQKKHQFFNNLLLNASEALPELESAWLLLNDSEQKNKIQETLEQSNPKPKPTESCVIVVNGKNPLETKAWHSWWAQYREQEFQGPESQTAMQKKLSFLNGEACIPVRTHDNKIKGTSSVGGLGTGDVLIGFDKTAFTSFQLEKSVNASMSDIDAKRYTDALNHLLTNQKFKFGNTLCAYWFSHKDAEDENVLAFLEQGEGDVTVSYAEEHAPKQILKQLREGQRMEVLQSHYYSLVLSGNSGRVMLRAWEETNFERLLENIADWFDDFSIVHRNGGKLAPRPKFMAVVGSTERELSDVPPPLIVNLWHSATLGRNIPDNAFSKTLLRVKNAILSDDPIQHASVGLLKAYHLRNRKDKCMEPYLNKEHPEPAYHCGRLLAILSRLQYRALGDVGAGVVQRYYGAVSQTPDQHIGRLIANAQNHLNKLDPGKAYGYEQQIAEILRAMTIKEDRFPSKLTLKEQSLFALGYYQQLTYRQKSAKDGITDPEENSNSNENN